MARRQFGARNGQVNLVLLKLEGLTPKQAHLIANAYQAVPASAREELRSAARQQLHTAPKIVRDAWSNARAFASDAVRAAAYNRAGVHYSKIGDDNELPWGAARAAARDAAAAWAVLPWLEPGLAGELMGPARTAFAFLKPR